MGNDQSIARGLQAKKRHPQTMQKDRMKGEQRLMGAKEAAKYLGLSYWALRELIN
jgi:hypothetical protein